MSLKQTFAASALAIALSVPLLTTARADDTLLNASYDVSRELYKDINPAFAAHYQTIAGKTVTINQSHAGSTKQALAVAEGLEADVVTLNQPTDLDFLASKGAVSKDWRTKFPNNAAPFTTTTVFLVRKGNPKAIKDWDDLAKQGISVVVPNPKTSGNGRYTYLAAWGYAVDKLGSPEKAKEFVAKLFANVPVFDGGGRGATTTFTQRNIGDVLVTFENEAALIAREIDGAGFDVVYPSLSIEAAPPIAVVEKVVEKRATAALAKEYLDFLYTADAQTIIARHDFRPRDAAVLKANAAKFPEIKTFDAAVKLGPWAELQKTHFADGGIYDQISVTKSTN